MKNKTLNIFYEEPQTDRWFKYDRYLRNIIRRVIRGKARPGGQMMVAINLLKGLDKLKIPYRFNDYKYAKKHPQELICVIGKPHLIFEKKFKNPILFGASVFSHPLSCPKLFEDYPNIKKVIVPGEWMKEMFAKYYNPKDLISWPVGIDTDLWNPSLKEDHQPIDFLIYDKIRWEHEKYEIDLINPLKNILKERDYSFEMIKYGSYEPEDLIKKVGRCKSVIFLCEHETQGLAYQQILSTNTAILAWDRGGYWQDPQFFPNQVKYEGGVSSVPYWDSRCGEKFKDLTNFVSSLEIFWENVKSNKYQPRDYILENLTLENSSLAYIKIVDNVTSQHNIET
jgi:hypothetical protein